MDPVAARDAISPELKLLSVLLGLWCGFFSGALWLRAMRAIPADLFEALGGASALVAVLLAASPFLGLFALWTARPRVRRAIHGSFLLAYALAFPWGISHEVPPALFGDRAFGFNFEFDFSPFPLRPR